MTEHKIYWGFGVWGLGIGDWGLLPSLSSSTLLVRDKFEVSFCVLYVN